jgi:hypothetical protein|tara:strand:- start:1998 stop:3434 length:1437 start_codon:yes stop_codon:yes gene_type:complete
MLSKPLKQKLYLFIILLGFFLSIILSSYYVNKYDKYNSDNYTHQLLKDETYYHWHQGAKIVKDVENGKNFFLAGDVTFTKPLQQRIYAIYSLITGYNLIDKWEPVARINLGGKLPYLIFQALVYFLSLFYFSKKIKKIFSKKIVFLIISFLALEPTIFQYHSSFWTESIYFSLQIIVFGMLLDKSINFKNNLIIGIFLGIAFLQRSAGLYYLFPIFIFYIFLFRKNFLIPFLSTTLGFSIILILIGSYNQYKTKVFYIVPPESTYTIHQYFANDILRIKLNLTQQEAAEYEIDLVNDWIKKNNIKLNQKVLNDENYKQTNVLNFRELFVNGSDKDKFYEYLNKRQFEILFNYPLVALKELTTRYLHFIVLNPTFNHYYNSFRNVNSDSEFHLSKTHKSWIPFRIIYTLVIYSFCLIGILELLKRRKFYELSLIILSVMYYIILLGWFGKTRLYVPSLIYLSIPFGVGLDMIINKYKNL